MFLDGELMFLGGEHMFAVGECMFADVEHKKQKEINNIFEI